MFKKNLFVFAALTATVVLSVSAFAGGNHKGKDVTFVVRVENVSTKDGVEAQDGSKYPFALSPGFFGVGKGQVQLFESGKKASPALEAQAEDGDPKLFAEELLGSLGRMNLGVFTDPVGTKMAAPIFAGGVFEFEFTAKKGMKFNFATMYGQSNDLFYAPASAIELFDRKGKPLVGDLTDKLQLWDAGTEVNQAPGLGSDQGPRQKGPNTGADENGVVRLVNDGFKYPATADVVRVTISAK